MKNIILCADDYGQNASISQAILELVREKRLSAVSCMTNMAYWPYAAKMLLPYQNEVAVGLHFNLTEGKALSSKLPRLFSLKELILKSQFRQLNPKQIIDELYAQLDKFVAEFGRLPDFIDGHQHVHQFPVVRDAVFEVYEKRLRGHGVFLRSTYNRNTLFKIYQRGFLKQLILLGCGGWQFKKELLKRNIPHNSGFSGIYNFSNSVPYEKRFAEFLQQVDSDGMIMCHPGLASSDNIAADEIYKSRATEYAFFSGDKFLTLLQEAGATLSKSLAGMTNKT